MKTIASKKFLKRATAIYMVAALLFANFPLSALADGLSVDLVANGQNSLTLTDASQPFTVSLNSQNAVSCDMTSPGTDSGISTSASMEIPAGHPYYPAVGGSTTFTVVCTDANGATASDSVTVSLEPTPTTPTVDVVANGSDGPITLNQGDTYVYSWNSSNATSCLQTSPNNSGISVSGSSATISPDNTTFYPKAGQPVTITITCTNGSQSATDSVIVNLATNTPNAVSVDVVANGSDGPITLNQGDTYVYSWNSANATSCLQTSPNNSGVSVSGSSATIFADNSGFYPTAGHPVTITITCTNGTTSATDSVVVNLASPNTVTVDVVANGSNGPLTLNSGDTYVYSWNSTNATSCLQTSPINSGISVSGSSATITSGNTSYYPTAGHPVTITITCTNGTTSATDSVVINLASVPPTGGGNSVTVDVKANGSDGPIDVLPSQTFTYTWNSTNATSCLQTSPVNSGVSVSGTSASIDVNHPYFPHQGLPTTITITCTNGTSTSSDSVVINLIHVPVSNTVTVDVKANGSDGPVTLTNGAPYVYTWTSTNATSCLFTSPLPGGPSGISVSGTSASIAPGHPLYPASGSSVTLTVTCTNGTSTATDSVIINADHQSCPAANITSPFTLSVAKGDAVNYTITTGGSNVSISVGTLPSWLTYSTSSQTISGTTTDAGTFNVNITATNNCGNDAKTLVITVTSDNGGGGGGGGGNNGGGGHHHGGGGGSVQGVVAECLFIKDYMRRDFTNDPIQVMRLQAFLKAIDGRSEVTVNGVFDQATFDAVSAFQMEYKDDILTPWGHTAPTGYVYILTLKKVNEIYCQHAFPLNEAQVQEIIAFRALLSSLRAQGYNIDNNGNIISAPKGSTSETIGTSTEATTTIELPIVGSANKGQNLRNLASSIFTLPVSLMQGLQCLYEFLLILIVLYVLANVLEDVLNKKNTLDESKKFRNKWIVISLGLVVAAILAYVFKELCLILPLIVALILSLIWIALRPKHSSIKASFKSWYLVIMARSKSIANNAKNKVEKKTDNK